jgi:hypothetical protein
MELPIDLIPDTNPPRFRWWQTSRNPANGEGVLQKCEGLLPPAIESAVAELIGVAKQLQRDLGTAAARIEAQAELLGKRAQRK